MNRRLSFIWMLLLGCFYAGGLMAQQVGNVTGIVESAQIPVSGADVMITSGADSRYESKTVTDGNGGFQVTGIPLGGVSLVVSDAQSQTIVKRSTTLNTNGETIHLNIDISQP